MFDLPKLHPIPILPYLTKLTIILLYQNTKFAKSNPIFLISEILQHNIKIRNIPLLFIISNLSIIG